MAKKSIIAGEYIIEITDNGHVDVLRVFRNAKSTMKDIAASKNFAVDEKWNTQDLGRHLIKEFGDGKTVKFDDITINKLPDSRIEIYQECKNTINALRTIAYQLHFEFDDKWNTQTFGSKLTDYLTEHKAEADKILQTPNTKKQKVEVIGKDDCIDEKFVFLQKDITMQLKQFAENKSTFPIRFVVETKDVENVENYFASVCKDDGINMVYIDCRNQRSYNDFCHMMRDVPEHTAIILSHVTEIPECIEQKNIGWAINSLKEEYQYFGLYDAKNIAVLMTFLPKDITANHTLSALNPMPGAYINLNNNTPT